MSRIDTRNRQAFSLVPVAPSLQIPTDHCRLSINGVTVFSRQGLDVHYYPWNIKEYNLHTAHLSVIEDCVYRRLLDYYYDTEAPIPKITQPVIRRLRLGSYSAEVDQILSEFFTLKRDGWHNSRCDIELKKYHDQKVTARTNGKLGGRPRRNTGLKTQGVISNNPAITQSVILANPDITQPKPNQEPRTKNQEPLLKKQSKEIFDFWRAVMNKKKAKFTPKRKEKIEARLKQGYTFDQIKSAIEGCAKNPHNMGQNDNGARYDDLTLICRSGEKLEWFIERNEQGAVQYENRQSDRKESLMERAYRQQQETFDEIDQRTANQANLRIVD